MNKEKDKDLDNLFKKRLDDPVDPIEFEEKDWDAMELMLDKQKRRGIIYMLPIISSVAALFLIFLGWWMFRPVKPDVAPKNQIQAVNHNPHAKIDTLKIAPQQQAVQQPTNNQTEITPAIPKFSGAQKPVDSKSNYAVALTRHKAIHSGLNSVKPGSDNYDDFKRKPLLASAEKPENIANSNKNIYNNGLDTLRQNVELLAASGSVNDLDIQTVTAVPITNAEIPKAAFKKVAAENAKGKIQMAEKPGFRPQYAISVLAAPDVNGVGSFTESKVGTNIGLLFSAGVSNKFTVSTGALYSVKPYMTGFENYHTNYTFKTNPVSVLADCRMLDIPLNIGYQLYNKHQNKFSVGTGLSSYIMLHESYTFNYASANTTGPEYFNVAHSSGYFFGIVNLNATYQRQLNSKVGFSIMPYLKLPLTNIGYSQVRLQTTGVAVGLNWNLNSLTR